MPEGEVMEIPPIDAELALAEVRARRAEVVDANLVPGWFWPSIGVLMLLFVAAVETGRPWLVAAGSVAYALGLATLIAALLRRSRVQVRNTLIGAHGAAAIVVFTLVLVGLGVGLGLALAALGVPAPATIACLPVAAGLAFGGPALMTYLRRVMLARPLAGPR
ncbi:hypothetical protein JKJ07_31710 [Actinoplanes sp. LDG1-01]|uniref:Integral membrane protein n=2 Tax=Paractinoplanes lichenicola TaxID=2802976 RepID=A0ABS1VX17_9ACTN|nr:hypothetical protein [Actinoplanes lichenicola]